MPRTEHAPGGAPHDVMPPGDGDRAEASIVDTVNHLFARFDVDGDASITLAEWLGVVDPDRADAVTAALARIDGDADGALSSTELTTALTALDSDASGTLDRSEVLAARAADGTPSAAEVLLMGGRHGHGAGADHDPRATDPVTIDTAATAAFAQFDSDGSGSLAVSELVAAIGAPHHGFGSTDGTARVGAALAALDGNADGALGVDELTAALQALDADGDGSLSAAEQGCPPTHDGSVDLVGVLLHHLDLPEG